MILKCQTDEEHMLSEVYFIPDLCNNIVILGQLVEEGCEVVLHSNLLWVNDKDERFLMKVRRSSNTLYKLIIEESKPACLMSKAEEDTWLWSCRLGHVNFKVMTFMSDKARKSFPQQTVYNALKTLKLVQRYICGPISPPTPGGKRYFFSCLWMTIAD